MDNPVYAVAVSVRPQYLSKESRPAEQRFVHSYSVTLTNNGNIGVKLLSRHWIITNGRNLKTQDVRGEGVVGQQPHLAPGQSYTYTSGSVMDSEVGSMHGEYQMLADDGHQFDAIIPAFTLAVPNSLN
jgi:ApaG protein